MKRKLENVVSNKNRLPKKYKICSLWNILDNNRLRVHASSQIYAWCRAVSQMAVKASHLCNFVIYRLLNEKERVEWPDFNKNSTFFQMFTVGANTKNFSNPINVIATMWKEKGSLIWPYRNRKEAIKNLRHKSDFNLINASVIAYKMEFVNNLRLNFDARQMKSLKEMMKRKLYPQFIVTIKQKTALAKVIRYFINGWIYSPRHSIFNPNQLDVIRNYYEKEIEEHRIILGEYSCANSLSLETIIKYYHFLNCKYNLKFALVPRTEIKMHQIKIDAEILKEVYGYTKNIGWSDVFNMEKIHKLASKKKWTFDQCISTDGFSCSVRFCRRDNTDTTDMAGEKKIEPKRKNITSDRKRKKRQSSIEYFEKPPEKKDWFKLARWFKMVDDMKDFADQEQYLAEYLPFYFTIWGVKTSRRGGAILSRIWSVDSIPPYLLLPIPHFFPNNNNN